MATPSARRFPLPAQEQSSTMVPETTPAEKRRQQVSESRPKSGLVIVESNVKKKSLSKIITYKNKKKSLLRRKTISNSI